ncbi:cell wall-binding repeat-containing protein [Desulfosporosinus shakirovi]
MATGNNYPEALAGSVYVAKHKAPIILEDDSLSEQVIHYLEA